MYTAEISFSRSTAFSIPLCAWWLVIIARTSLSCSNAFRLYQNEPFAEENLLEKSKKQLTKQKFYSIINKCSARAQKCASGSVVEHHLAKVGAAGSSPVSRFFFLPEMNHLRFLFSFSKKNFSVFLFSSDLRISLRNHPNLHSRLIAGSETLC